MRGINGIYDNKSLLRVPCEFHSASKSSEFTTIGHVWPSFCGQKGIFLKVLAMRCNLTPGCPGRVRVQEPRQRQVPQSQCGRETQTQHTCGCGAVSRNQAAGKRNSNLQDLPHLKPHWLPKGCSRLMGRGGHGRVLPAASFRLALSATLN